MADAQAELVRKAEAAAMWQARAEFLAGQLEQAQLALGGTERDHIGGDTVFRRFSGGIRRADSDATRNAAAGSLVDALA